MKHPAKTVLFVASTIVAVSLAIPMQVQATCQNLSGQTVPVAMGRFVFKNSTEVGHAKAYNSQDGFNQSSTELNLGFGTTAGFLPSGAGFNITYANALVDNGSSACNRATFGNTLTVTNGDRCDGSVINSWTSTWDVNTCGLADGFFRGQIQNGHFGVGFAPSYFIALGIRKQVGAIFVDVAQSTGCMKVSTSPGASGCSDPL